MAKAQTSAPGLSVSAGGLADLGSCTLAAPSEAGAAANATIADRRRRPHVATAQPAACTSRRVAQAWRRARRCP